MAMADASLAARSQSRPAGPARSGAKRFHGRLKIDADVLPRRRRRRLRHRRVGSPHRRHQGRERRSAVRADQLRGSLVLDAAGHQRRLQQVLLRRSRHRPSASTASASSSTASPARSPTGASKTATSPRAEDGERFYRDLTWLCLHQHGAFNSPVWFNVGLFHQYGVTRRQVQLALGCRRPATSSSPRIPTSIPQGSACFIQHVDDNMEDIMELARSEAMLFKFGSGTGTDLSTLRSHREKLAGGGKPSGPLSFMRVYDQIAAVVKSGGKTRRAAKMQSHQGLASRRDGVHRVQVEGREEGPRPDRKGRLRVELQRRSLQLDHVPEREPLGPRHRRVHASRREGRASGPPAG